MSLMHMMFLCGQLCLIRASHVNLISSEVGDKIMTLAEQLIDEGMAKGIQKGRQEGLQEGHQKGKLEVAERLLSEGIELTFVAKMTGLSLERLETLQEE